MSIFVFISLFMPMMEMGLQGDIKSIEANEIILCALWLPGTDKPLIKRLFVSVSALTPPINEELTVSGRDICRRRRRRRRRICTSRGQRKRPPHRTGQQGEEGTVRKGRRDSDGTGKESHQEGNQPGKRWLSNPLLGNPLLY